MSDSDIMDILKVSREKNSAFGVTGILLFYNKTNQFMQILEGEKKVIFDLYNLISRDKRHSGLKLVYDGSVSERSFANWSMAFTNYESLDRSRLEGYSRFYEQGFTDELIKDDHTTAIKIFQSFKTLLP